MATATGQTEGARVMDANGWVKVDERLPEVPYTTGDNICSSDSVACLASFPVRSAYGSYFKMVMALYFPRIGQKWFLRKNSGLPSKDITHKVTHWQPFPKGPEGL